MDIWYMNIWHSINLCLQQYSVWWFFYFWFFNGFFLGGGGFKLRLHVSVTPIFPLFCWWITTYTNQETSAVSSNQDPLTLWYVKPGPGQILHWSHRIRSIHGSLPIYSTHRTRTCVITVGHWQGQEIANQPYIHIYLCMFVNESQ